MHKYAVLLAVFVALLCPVVVLADPTPTPEPPGCEYVTLAFYENLNGGGVEQTVAFAAATGEQLTPNNDCTLVESSGAITATTVSSGTTYTVLTDGRYLCSATFAAAPETPFYVRICPEAGSGAYSEFAAEDGAQGFSESAIEGAGPLQPYPVQEPSTRLIPGLVIDFADIWHIMRVAYTAFLIIARKRFFVILTIILVTTAAAGLIIRVTMIKQPDI